MMSYRLYQAWLIHLIQKSLNWVNLASSVALANETADKLLAAENLGEQKFSSFTSTNLKSDMPDLFEKIERNNIGSFGSSKIKTAKYSKGKEMSLKTSRDLLVRLLIIAKSLKVNLREVLSYSLGVYPLSLSTPSGTFVKTANSKLYEIIQDSDENPKEMSWLWMLWLYCKPLKENGQHLAA